MLSVDKDLREKLLFQKLVWQKGYFSFADVPIITMRAERGSLRRDEVTDADVLAYRFDETLARQIEVADCKSGSESHNRLLWLKGLQDYLSASGGHFVSRSISKKFPEVSKRLNLHLWKPDEIEKLLTEQKSHSFKHLFSEEAYLRFKATHGSLKDKNKVIYSNFLKFDYWRLPPKRRLQSLMFNFSYIAKELLSSENDKILVFRTLIKLSLSLLELGSFIMTQDRQNIHTLTESYIFGPADEVAVKKEAIRTRGGTESDFYPPYYQPLLDILASLIRRSDCSKDICRLEIEYLFESNLLNNDISLSTFSDSYRDKAVTAKIAKDVAGFLASSAKLDPPRFRQVF